uniref:Uncharacterized protein n=1 Tax=Arundo donax TaxID=35708 RepID=A0A0A9G340_ARUDO
MVDWIMQMTIAIMRRVEESFTESVPYIRVGDMQCLHVASFCRTWQQH